MSALGVLLAAGSSRRFGRDKGRALLGGRTLIAHVAERTAPQVELLVLNARGRDMSAEAHGLEVLYDSHPDGGPLAGILAALSLAQERGFTHVASFACDTPFVPRDTVRRLNGTLAQGGADYAAAKHGANAHRILALWPVTVRERLYAAFVKGTRSMREVEEVLQPAWTDFSDDHDGPEGDPFFNVNSEDDLKLAEGWFARRE